MISRIYSAQLVQVSLQATYIYMRRGTEKVH
jgi:hypothetical protein